MVIHPLDKNLNGKTLTSKQFDCATMIEYNNTVKKLNNENLFTAMVTLVKKADNGYIIYKWKKPDSNKSVQKLSYIIKIPHYNWILGSGIYIDDIEKEYKNTLFQYLKFIIPLFFLIIILTAVILKKINTLQKKLHAKQKSIENIAYTDQLTELLNRASFDKKFEEILNESCKKNKKFSILFLDLDNFKPINDTYGHDIGDKVLKIVAKRVKNSLRKNDIIARIGGDEFVVLLPEVSKENISEIIMKLNNAVKKPIKIDSLLIQTSVSIGYSVYPDDGKNKFDLIKKADKLMYLDKQQKKQKD
ncbi:sensor domain-containing diguanylate cyclase [Nautilia sp. PV-1]|uniref:sensor domain-containing diguanylate cyclase n=1 Tax=Nautilia sp. PV-1 TaxID=2579250 RepID=UPI000FDAE29F|nr:sensor domain-containing diguanylate cyclase [Nautilia sp. PV-1]